LESSWNKLYKRKKLTIDKILKNNFSKSLKIEKQISLKENKSLATRKSSELVLNALTKENNTLIGGSADLAGSNNTKTKYHKVISSDNFNGDYIHYGVREHAMCGIMNGIAQ
jgi:transketolase